MINNRSRRRRKKAFSTKSIAIGIGVTFLFLWSGLSGSSDDANVSVEEAREALKPENLDDLQKLSPEERKARLKAYGKAMGTDFALKMSQSKASNENRRDRPRRHGPPEEIRKAMEKLSDEEKEAFREGIHQEMRKAFHQHMKEKIDKFYNASAEEQNKLLDEEAQRMMERHKRHEERNANGKKDDKGGPPHFRNRTEEQRENHMRERLDNSSPEERAKVHNYFRQVHERAEQLRKNQK